MKFLRLYAYIFLLTFTQHITCMDGFETLSSCFDQLSSLLPNVELESPKPKLAETTPPRAPTPSASAQVKRAATSTIVVKKKPVRKKHKPELTETTHTRTPTPVDIDPLPDITNAPLVTKTVKTTAKDLTEDKPFTCTFCPHTTTKKSYLTTHMKKHKRTFSCPEPECTYQSNSEDSLNGHIRIHTGERPFVCTYCFYTGRLKHHLTQHMRSHREDKPYGVQLPIAFLIISSITFQQGLT